MLLEAEPQEGKARNAILSYYLYIYIYVCIYKHIFKIIITYYYIYCNSLQSLSVPGHPQPERTG